MVYNIKLRGRQGDREREGKSVTERESGEESVSASQIVRGREEETNGGRKRKKKMGGRRVIESGTEKVSRRCQRQHFKAQGLVSGCATDYVSPRRCDKLLLFWVQTLDFSFFFWNQFVRRSQIQPNGLEIKSYHGNDISRQKKASSWHNFTFC